MNRIKMFNILNNIFGSVIKKCKNILFVLNVVFICGTEYLLYKLLFKDYSLFIHRITSKLASINILYVKIFQAIALNNNMIDDAMNTSLMRFTDNVDWNYDDIQYKDLIEVANKYDLQMYFDTSFIPVNSGMISLVFKLSKKSKEDEFVIVKMKRKNIQVKLEEGIDNLLFLIKMTYFIPMINKYQLADIISKNIEIIKHQTNFLEEVDNMNQFRERCKHLKYVKIPKADRSVTEEYPDIILMDYIDGLTINKIDEKDHKTFAKLVMKFGFVTTIIHGVAHGDLHSGNILFIKDENDAKYTHKIGIIDFGIIFELENEFKEFMFDIFSKLFEMTPRETAEKILQSNIFEPHGIFKQMPLEDYQAILSFVENIISETIHDSKKVDQIQIYKCINKMKECFLNKKWTLRPSDNFVKSQLVLAMAHGVTMMLCKDDFVTLMDECIDELFQFPLFL